MAAITKHRNFFSCSLLLYLNELKNLLVRKAYDVQQTEGDDDGHKMITIDHIALSQAS
jgi:hypothetical protein